MALSNSACRINSFNSSLTDFISSSQSAATRWLT
jgi:hypothetical protein